MSPRKVLITAFAVVAALAATSVGTTSATADALQRPPRPEAIPPRPADAITGTDFARATVGVGGAERQRRAVLELLAGNLPSFLRTLVPVRLEHTGADGAHRVATIWTMPDYLAIGSDDDFLRVPLTMPSATAVADAFGFVLPTTRMVDAIEAQAAVRLEPAPMKPGPKMRSSAYYLRHRELIEGQRDGATLGLLTAGHKKDVVLSMRLAHKPDRIAIYGWHRRDHRPIQPLSTVHGARYADYSHGLRLIWRTVWIDGAPRPIEEVLADPALAPVLSDEGPIDLRRLLER